MGLIYGNLQRFDACRRDVQRLREFISIDTWIEIERRQAAAKPKTSPEQIEEIGLRSHVCMGVLRKHRPFEDSRVNSDVSPSTK